MDDGFVFSEDPSLKESIILVFLNLSSGRSGINYYFLQNVKLSPVSPVVFL